MGKYTNKTCCFTGHRIIPPGEESKILIRVRHRLIPLIQSGVTYFGVGGALGFDTMMANLLLELKKENSRMRVIEVLPFEGYRAKWTPEQQLHAKNLDRQMDKIVYVSKEPSRGISCQRQASGRWFSLLHQLLQQGNGRHSLHREVRFRAGPNCVQCLLF